jgi:hypothetical protein
MLDWCCMIQKTQRRQPARGGNARERSDLNRHRFRDPFVLVVQALLVRRARPRRLRDTTLQRTGARAPSVGGPGLLKVKEMRFLSHLQRDRIGHLSEQHRKYLVAAPQSHPI